MSIKLYTGANWTICSIMRGGYVAVKRQTEKGILRARGQNEVIFKMLILKICKGNASTDLLTTFKTKFASVFLLVHPCCVPFLRIMGLFLLSCGYLHAPPAKDKSPKASA